jgi:predicted secreted protein
MKLTFLLFIYVNAWFVCLFMVLPFFVKAQSKEEGEVVYAGAPRSIVWKRALLVNSLVALVATGAMAWLIQSGLINVKG